MSILEAILLGLVQGLTEFIPVSSSGHLLITHEVLGTNENSLAFDVALHVGTLAAVLIYFRSDVIKLIQNVAKDNKDGRLARVLLIATIPAAVAGFLLSDFIDEHVRSPLVVAITLASVGLLMLYVDKLNNKDTQKEVDIKQGLEIGFAQALALIPGVSRSGITITAGIFTGMSRTQAARFSFLLAIPIIAGSALGILVQDQSVFEDTGVELFGGVVAAFISGLIAIKFMIGAIARLGLKPFAYYRIVLALIMLMFL